MGGYYDDEDDGFLQEDYVAESCPDNDTPELLDNDDKSTSSKSVNSDNNDMNTELCLYVNDCIESLGLKPCAFEWPSLSLQTRLSFLAELARIRDEHKDDVDIYNKTRDIAFYLDTRRLFDEVHKRCKKFSVGQNKTSVNDVFDQLYVIANDQWVKYDPSRKTLFSNFVLQHIKKINPDELRAPMSVTSNIESSFRSFAAKRNEYLKKNNLESVDDTQLRLLLGVTDDKIKKFHEWEARSNPKSFESDEGNKQLESSSFENPTNAMAQKELLEKFQKSTDALGLDEAEKKARDMLFDYRPKASKSKNNDKIIKTAQKLDDNFVALLSTETGLSEEDIRKLWARIKLCLRSDKEFCEYVNQRPKKPSERLRTNSNNTIANGMREYLENIHDDEDDEVFEDYNQAKLPSSYDSRSVHYYDEYVLDLSSKGVSKLPKPNNKDNHPEVEQTLPARTEDLFEDELYSEEMPEVAVKPDSGSAVPVEEQPVQTAANRRTRKKSVTIESAPDIATLVNAVQDEPVVQEEPLNDLPVVHEDVAVPASEEPSTVVSEADVKALDEEEERRLHRREVKRAAAERRKARGIAENNMGLPKEIPAASSEEADVVQKQIAAARAAASATTSMSSQKKPRKKRKDVNANPAVTSGVVVTVTDTVPPLPEQDIQSKVSSTVIRTGVIHEEVTPLTAPVVTAVPSELEPDYETTLAFFNGICRKIDNADTSIAEIENETAVLEERDAAINKVIEGAQALGDLDNEYIRMKIEEKTSINTRLRKNIMEAEQVRKGLPLLGEIRDKLKEYLDTFSK